MKKIETTLDGKPLSEEAKQNLHYFRRMVAARQEAEEAKEATQSRLSRAGVRVFSEEEKAAFLATRKDLVG